MGTRFKALKEFEEYEFEEYEFEERDAPKGNYFALRMDAPHVRLQKYNGVWVDLPDPGSVILEVPFMKINGDTCVLFMDKITARCVYFGDTAVSWCHEKDGQFIVYVGRYEFVGKQPVRYDDIRGVDI